jgi:dATP pyrophosphohydrolase
MRAPFQVLVIPFRRTETGIQYAVLRRRDSGFWQFVAGGGEDRETPRDAALRETKEEIGIAHPDGLQKLDSMSTIPKNIFASADSWGSDIYVVPQYCFAIDATGARLRLSHEHTEARWLGYEEAYALLRWDSNRNALWELKERLKRTPAPKHGDDTSEACKNDPSRDPR